MRLHRLEATAFGPFADTVAVDFDALSAAGLFLLSGPTGAGKSSVLDAVCFALYGDVPGDRSTAKRLRSDLAAPDAAPRVVLEVTLCARRLRLTRSPSWTRPKKRGTGRTTVPAKVLTEELVAGRWETRSTRLDETGHLVTELVGMTLTQFCQVALLPQGEFQAFLRSRPDDRQRLLEQLFRTRRFARAEDWLREHRLELSRRSRHHEKGVADAVSRLSETAGAPPPDSWDLDDLTTPAQEGACTAWAAALLADAGARCAVARTDAEASHAAAVATEEALSEGRRLADQQRRHGAALRSLAALEDDAAAHGERCAALDRARAARTVGPLVELVRAADARVAAARATLDDVTAALPDDAGPDLAAYEQGLRAEHTTAAAAVDDEAACVATRLVIASYDKRLAEIERADADAAAVQAGLPAERAAADADVAASQRATQELPALRDELTRLRSRLAAAETVARLEGELSEALPRRAAAVDAAQQALDVVQDLRERRLQGMAAEIAGGLAAGCSCPVCGSSDHPDPARPAHGAPTADDERAARRAADDASTERLLREEHVRDLEKRVDLARHAADGSATALADLVAAAAARQRQAAVLAAALAERTARRDELARREAACERERQELRVERAGVLAAREQTLAAHERHAAAVRAVLDGRPDADVAALLARLDAALGLVARARAARDEHGAAAADHARCTEALLGALARSPFGDAAEVEAASLPDAAVEELAATVRAHEEARTVARAVLDDPAVAAAAARPAPDVGRLETAHRDATGLARVHEAALTRATLRCDRLRDLAARLATLLEAWAPLRAELAVAAHLSQFVDGKAADNRLQMRLSAYVLAHRLSQVVDAANERLVTMSDRRYSLEHTGRRGAGEQRGGLSLLVRDDWTGEARDPATLSGGETFVVSLALALGLADVLTQQSDAGAAGDARLETLFVDEGFGSLDADTLDDVMGTLDALREGGRVVGVVSHVAEMRDRIPARLDVLKRRRGSTLRAAYA